MRVEGGAVDGYGEYGAAVGEGGGGAEDPFDFEGVVAGGGEDGG